jgi:NhaA family Na+:H+ antiporter
MPIFALANAGLPLAGKSLEYLAAPVPLGIILGLVVGKQVGITGFSWLAVKLGWATLPTGVNWRLIYGAAVLGGIGFTMSLFIGNLAFGETPALLEAAKLGVLVASLICALLGIGVLVTAPKRPETEG